MPELPEVETIAATLRQGSKDIPSLIGRKIIGALVLWEKTLAGMPSQEFIARIQGQGIQDIRRRGKFLLFMLTKDVLLIHLRMSGDLLVEPDSNPIAQHYRLVILLDRGLRLAFNDPRKFGRVWLTNTPDSVLGSLGPEPLDERFSGRDFYRKLQACRRQLKPLLLDQSFLAGLGNIYTDEALHMAKIHPLVRADTLTRTQTDELLKSIRQVLHEGIRRQGASIDWVYRGGDFQNYFRVYRRTGLPCPECGAPVQKMIIGQRSTHFCPVCQLMNL
jgi:formamidopyrimidine-DNA glycosylase